MAVNPFTRRRPLGLAAITLVALGCNLALTPPAAAPATLAAMNATAASAESTAMMPTATLPAATATDQPTATSTATQTAGPPPVVNVAASGGRLNVRRGPGPEYDTVGALRNGQSSLATARNEDGTWVVINRPDTSTTLGWITLKTQYTAVTGDVAGLPLLAVEAALPAYVRNCTPHEMLVMPAGAILLNRSAAPENQLQFFPGDYSVIDQTNDSTVAEITVFEGKTIDIKKDSSGKSFNCP
jgi:uncharacterized protein YgiM (DUF1202 family)